VSLLRIAEWIEQRVAKRDRDVPNPGICRWKESPLVAVGDRQCFDLDDLRAE
jgi:hypothetical protein